MADETHQSIRQPGQPKATPAQKRYNDPAIKGASTAINRGQAKETMIDRPPKTNEKEA